MDTGPDATATDALAEAIVRPRFLAFLDIVGDPVRATTWAVPVTFASGATGDDDIDGQIFDALDPDLVSISPVHYGEGGADRVTARLSGLMLDPDDQDRYAAIANTANWQGRRAMLAMSLVDQAYAPAGNWWSYFDGRMVDLKIGGSRESQTIEVEIETYLAALSPASNRTYLDQSDFDPDDRSAAASIGSATLSRRGSGAVSYPQPIETGLGRAERYIHRYNMP